MPSTYGHAYVTDPARLYEADLRYLIHALGLTPSR